MCGENKQRFSLCVCLWGSRKACFDNIPRCCSQLYAYVLVLIAIVDSSSIIFGVVIDYSVCLIETEHMLN